MGEPSPANNSPAAGGPDNEPDGALDPVDRAFLAQRFAGGPLIFGAISIVTSVCILGLVPGTLGLRSGIDLWRAGCRRAIVLAGIATSAVGIVASVIGALLWGALLAGILLGRDAMRETERWRGRTVDARTLDAWHPDGRQVVAWPIADAGTERLALLFITTDPAIDPVVTTQAIASAARVAAAHPTCRFSVVAPFALAEEAQATVLASGTPCAIVHAPIDLPRPLDAVSAFPTLVTIDRSGRIEFALVGARGDDELARIFSGEAARIAGERDAQAADARAKPRSDSRN
ncbi:MAG: hypothetical protein LW806_02305 [Planctomycetaceae bacterium]|nr:hypothetical protein [Planctomycetaceae bacterium]